MANILIGGVNLKTLGMHGGRANAKDYGALANDTYDNQGILQALVDAWEALDGGTIVLPASQEGSRYRLTSGVVNASVNTVVSFSGTGGSADLYSAGGNPASVLWLDSDTDDAAIITYANTGQAGGQIVERIKFMGNNDTDGLGANQSGIVFRGTAHRHLIRDCGFQYLSGYAVAHDPTASNYNQNSSMRDCHFWAVGGCFGPTEEYVAAGLYLFNTQYTFDNVGLDSAIGWPSWGHTPKPHIFDLRATREVAFLGNCVIEGIVVTAGITSVFALASSSATFGNIHYEITSNDPDYLFALYGIAGDYYNSTGEKRLKIDSTNVAVGVPIWFENDASNECNVEIGLLSSYNADSITDVFEWEDGINVNSSGHVKVDYLQSKYPFEIPETYRGRVTVGLTGADHQKRLIVNTGARLLMSWNPNKGSLLGDWGDVSIDDVSATVDSHAIEADGNYLCQRFTGDSTFFFPYLRIVFRADKYEGASFVLACRYRVTVDAADSGISPWIYASTNVAQFEQWPGTLNKNLTDYSTGMANALFLDGIVDPNRWIQFRPLGGTPTVPVVLRLAALEIWLGQPSDVLLTPAPVPQVPTFSASDATPSVTGHKTWKTGTSGLTITDLDDFPAGEERTIISKGAIVFDTTGTNLVGSSVDITTASGDITRWVSEDGTTKRLLAFVDVSVDNSGGA